VSDTPKECAFHLSLRPRGDLAVSVSDGVGSEPARKWQAVISQKRLDRDLGLMWSI
jgi:hypothetical protein